MCSVILDNSILNNELLPFGEKIWLCEGPSISANLGFKYSTRMAIIKLANDELLIWSPIELNNELKNLISNLGKVAHIIAPNNFHHLYLNQYLMAFKDAKLYASEKLRNKKIDLKFDVHLEDGLPDILSKELELVIVEGNFMIEEAVFHHKPSGTTIFADLLQQLPKGMNKGWRFLIAYLDGLIGDIPQVPFKFKISFFNKKKTKQSIKTILNWPTQQLVFAHGNPIKENANKIIKNAFYWLRP